MRYIIHSNYGTTGGHQALHQLSSVLGSFGKDAYMMYPPQGETQVVPLWSELYGVNKFLHRSETPDEPDQIHIIPANWGINWYQFDAETPSGMQITGFPPNGNNPYQSKKVIWWLGVTPWQDWSQNGIDTSVDLSHPNINKAHHACQSWYAYNFLISSGLVDPSKVFMLSDYTNSFYLKSEYELFSYHHKRNNIVLYNGVRGLHNTNKIIELCKNMNCIFVKIENLNWEQLRALGLKSKIYIDFGPHTGKDRLPREMASCGCIVITGNEGTAASDDLPDGIRKFSNHNGEYDYESVKTRIQNDLDNYIEAFLDENQVSYRMKIRKEKELFTKETRNMVSIIENL
jgi:hypothetical protein